MKEATPQKEPIQVPITIQTEQKELIIWQGITPTLPVDHPIPIRITGTLQAPYQFLEGKALNPADCHILIDFNGSKLILKTDDRNKFSECTITGTLLDNADLQVFGINTTKRYTVHEFIRFIREFRYFFNDKDQHKTLISSLQNWHVKIEKVIKEQDDNRGNANYSFETRVKEVELMSSFDLNIPVYQGYPPVKLNVEIGLDPKNLSVQLFLFSDELFQLEKEEKEYWMNNELNKFKDFKCSKVVLS